MVHTIKYDETLQKIDLKSITKIESIKDGIIKDLFHDIYDKLSVEQLCVPLRLKYLIKKNSSIKKNNVIGLTKAYVKLLVIRYHIRTNNNKKQILKIIDEFKNQFVSFDLLLSLYTIESKTIYLIYKIIFQKIKQNFTKTEIIKYITSVDIFRTQKTILEFMLYDMEKFDSINLIKKSFEDNIISSDMIFESDDITCWNKSFREDLLFNDEYDKLYPNNYNDLYEMIVIDDNSVEKYSGKVDVIDSKYYEEIIKIHDVKYNDRINTYNEFSKITQNIKYL